MSDGSPVFLLSPARTDGRRAQIVLSEKAEFEVARQLRTEGGAALGDVFSFLSGLYFRGKFIYAKAFTQASQQSSHIAVITSNRGLMSPFQRIRTEDLRTFSSVDIAGSDPRYLEPLCKDIEQLATHVDAQSPVVILGSIATGKYVDVLLKTFGERLVFPADFVGRGDMSRGGLLLRHAESGEPLEYIPVHGAIRHGKRPPKLPAPAYRR